MKFYFIFLCLISIFWASEGWLTTIPSYVRHTKSHNLYASIKNPPAPSLIHAEGSGSSCRIKVVGVGGGGGNAINRMMESSTGVLGVELWAVNTDAQALARNLAPNKLNIGNVTSRGLGAGGCPEVGTRAAVESREDICEMVKGSDLVFVTAGMGGGTGSGAAPVVAECAKEAGALTVGVVTKPFGFEGRKRLQQAKQAISDLKNKVDTLIVVSNDKLLQIVPENTPLTDAFLVADDILRQGVVGISEIIIKPGLVNVDFADVRTIMGNAGTALMGIGHGKGKNRAIDAAITAISSPLLDLPITKAKGIVFNIVGGTDMTLQEINAAADVIYQNVDPDANIIFGALVDEKITSGELSITVLATGFSTDYFENELAEAIAASPPDSTTVSKTKSDFTEPVESNKPSKASKSMSSNEKSSSNKPNKTFYIEKTPIIEEEIIKNPEDNTLKMRLSNLAKAKMDFELNEASTVELEEELNRRKGSNNKKSNGGIMGMFRSLIFGDKQ